MAEAFSWCAECGRFSGRACCWGRGDVCARCDAGHEAAGDDSDAGPFAALAAARAAVRQLDGAGAAFAGVESAIGSIGAAGPAEALGAWEDAWLAAASLRVRIDSGRNAALSRLRSLPSSELERAMELEQDLATVVASHDARWQSLADEIAIAGRQVAETAMPPVAARRAVRSTRRPPAETVGEPVSTLPAAAVAVPVPVLMPDRATIVVEAGAGALPDRGPAATVTAAATPTPPAPAAATPTPATPTPATPTPATPTPPAPAAKQPPPPQTAAVATAAAVPPAASGPPTAPARPSPAPQAAAPRDSAPPPARSASSAVVDTAAASGTAKHDAAQVVASAPASRAPASRAPAPRAPAPTAPGPSRRAPTGPRAWARQPRWLGAAVLFAVFALGGGLMARGMGLIGADPGSAANQDADRGVGVEPAAPQSPGSASPATASPIQTAIAPEPVLRFDLLTVGPLEAGEPQIARIIGAPEVESFPTAFDRSLRLTGTLSGVCLSLPGGAAPLPSVAFDIHLGQAGSDGQIGIRLGDREATLELGALAALDRDAWYHVQTNRTSDGWFVAVSAPDVAQPLVEVELGSEPRSDAGPRGEACLTASAAPPDAAIFVDNLQLAQ